MSQTYSYSLSADFPSGAINPTKLQDEIEKSSIVTALDYVTGPINVTGDDVDIVFAAALSAGDKTTLDGDTTGPAGGLIAAHDNTPSPLIPKATADGVQLVQQEVQTSGWQMCDRDIKLVTCEMDGAVAVEDLKVDLSTYLEVEWGECVLVNVYKWDQDPNPTEMVVCTDQGDADSHGRLSVFDYCAKDLATNPVEIDMKDGGAIADLDIPANERYDHRAYAIGAPDVPPAIVRFFDGYLGAQPDGRIEAKSPQAKRLPIVPVPAVGVMRLFFYHPPGAKRTHILRLVTYRPLGSM